ncbi:MULTISPECIES: hypothetical protein [unclassified Microcoleus]|uniref:hypothetical protein n=1 Tax=unclassified Microcoleus TaxID=2642155 RepID=UPI002FD3272E
MNRKILSTTIITAITITITILSAVLLPFNSPSFAQVSPQVIPRIEVIEDSEGIPPSYRLVISRTQDDVYVFCPTNFEPELNYLRNVKGIKCKPFTSP